jgi:hypothetical protein
MVKIITSQDSVRIEISGWDKIWSFKGSLTISKDSITRLYKYDGALKPPFWRCPGTAIPRVIIAGTYYGRGRKEFWNTHFRKSAIVFELKNAEYTRIVVDVEDCDKILAELKTQST